jgi:hypothetical protein
MSTPNPQRRRARRLLQEINEYTGTWLAKGWATPKLPAATEAVLRAAAQGKAVAPAELDRVLAAAETLETKLAFGILKHFPKIEDVAC